MKRYGQIIRVKPEKLENYKVYHANVWPDILDLIRECNIRNYSIFYKDGYLFNTPTHLCRLRYFGDENKWGFAFYTYSNEKYELSVFPNGEFFGTPEEAFATSANVYLR